MASTPNIDSTMASTPDINSAMASTPHGNSTTASNADKSSSKPPLKEMTREEYRALIKRQNRRDRIEMAWEETELMKKFRRDVEYIDRYVADKERHTMGTRKAIQNFESIPDDFFPEESSAIPGLCKSIAEEEVQDPIIPSEQCLTPEDPSEFNSSKLKWRMKVMETAREVEERVDNWYKSKNLWYEK